MHISRISKWSMAPVLLFLCAAIVAQTPSPSGGTRPDQQSAVHTVEAATPAEPSTLKNAGQKQTSAGEQKSADAASPAAITFETAAPVEFTVQENAIEKQASAGEQKPADSPAPAAIVLPAGTRILMALKSPLHTTSAVAGSGLYLETAFPVVQENRVVIPVRTRISGTVEKDQRPGRVKGRAQFLFRFTSMVFANNYVLPIAGALQSLPGNTTLRLQDQEGTIEPVDQIDRDVATLAKAAAAGFVVGTVRGGSIRPNPHSAIDAAIGAGLGLGKVLFTRGDEIHLEYGSLVEMVLTRPVSIEPEHLPSQADLVAQSNYELLEENGARESANKAAAAAAAAKAHKSHLGGLRWLWLLALIR